MPDKFSNLIRVKEYLWEQLVSDSVPEYAKQAVEEFCDGIDDFYFRDVENPFDSEGALLERIFGLGTEGIKGEKTASFKYQVLLQDFYLNLAYHYCWGCRRERFSFLIKSINAIKSLDREKLKKILPVYLFDQNIRIESLSDLEEIKGKLSLPLRYLIDAAWVGEQKKLCANRHKDAGPRIKPNSIDLADVSKPDRIRKRINRSSYIRFCREEPGYDEVIKTWEDVTVDIP